MGFLKIIGRALVIVILGAGLGLGANALRKDGLPLSGAEEASPEAGGACTAGPATRVPDIQIEEARRLYGRPGVTFIDARSAGEYGAGHIAGALHLPYEVAARAAGKSTLPVPRDHRLIVYCDSSCELSELLAQVLSQSGCERVRVLKGGYPGWAAAGLPIAKGPPR